MLVFWIETIFIAAFPALFVSSSAIFYWSQLTKPWLFVALGLVVLYIIYVAIFYILPSHIEYTSFVESGQAIDEVKNYKSVDQKGNTNSSQLFLYAKHLLIFAILAIPVLWFLFKLFATKEP
jgi:hypothetical protein